MFCQDYISYKQSSHTWAYGGTSRREWWTERKRSNWEQLWKSSWSNRFSGPAHRCLPLSLPLSVPDRFSPCSLFTHSVTHTHTAWQAFSILINSLFLHCAWSLISCFACVTTVPCNYEEVTPPSTFQRLQTRGVDGHACTHTWDDCWVFALHPISFRFTWELHQIRCYQVRSTPSHLWHFVSTPPPLPHQGEQRGVIKIKNQYASCKARKPHK